MKRQAPTRTHRQMVAAWKKDPEFQVAYDELDTEFALLRQLLAARMRAIMFLLLDYEYRNVLA